MSTSPQRDHGEVVRGRGGLSWAWLFPAVALAAGAWMFAEHLAARGPEIEVRFADAPGIEAGKTALIYRGVVAGRVTEVNLDVSLSQAVVKIRLEKFAAGLAVETTDFWIEKPVLSLQGASGLTSLIQGNSIHARMGTGKRRTEFRGLDSSPVLAMDETAVRVRLECDETQPLDRGAPVTFRGVKVGRVREQSLSDDGRPYIDLEIQESKRALLKTTARFWVVPATSVTVGPGGIRLSMSGLDALIQGGVAFDDFGVPGSMLPDGSTARLLGNPELARACGEPFTIGFPSAKGIRPGQTRLTYLGFPVGIITDVRAVDGRAEVSAQFERSYDHLRKAGTVFTLVEPTISLQGISGLETLITGVTIDCAPGGGGLRTSFSGMVPKGRDEVMESSASGRKFRLLSAGTPIAVGAALLYRDMQIGSVLEKKLGRDGRTVELTVGVQDQYAKLVRSSSVFWQERGLRGNFGFIGIRLQTATPLPLTGGGAIAMATPDESAPAAAAGSSFTLYDKPKKEWTKLFESPVPPGR